MNEPQTLGIVAGAGELPIALARAVRENGRPVFLLALEGIADSAQAAEFPHASAAIGEVAKIIGILKEAGCAEITLAGRVSRPDFSKLRLDRMASLYLPQILAAALKGDDALLRAVIQILEKQQFRVVGAEEITRQLLIPAGSLGNIAPQPRDFRDIEHGARIVAALGQFDIGQAAVVCDGLVLAVEAAEGTDAMLSRVATLPQPLRGTPLARRGVMVKAPKPQQERRVDLPVIGVNTVESAAAAGLAGIAAETGAVLVLNRNRVIETADQYGVFVHGYTPAKPQEIRGG